MPKKCLKIGLYVLLVFFLTAVAFLFYQNYQLRQQIQQAQVATSTPTAATPTPAPTANWKMYKNEKHGYEMEYSPSYQADVSENALCLRNFSEQSYCDISVFSKTIGEIIADDSLNNNFLRTEESFKYFFSGVKISTNNDVGGYTLYVNEGGNNLFKATYDLKNNDFESIALRSFIINSAPGSAANIGVQLQISSGNDPIPIKIVGSKVMVPRIDGKELEITIQITYAQEKLEIFE